MAEPLSSSPLPKPLPLEPIKQPARLWFFWLVGLLIFACLALVIVLNILSSRQRLDRDKLDAARLRWKLADIKDYDIDVRVTGSAPGHYQVRVRGGQVVQGLMNGQPFQDLRLAWPWTIDGLLEEVLPRELETLQSPEGHRCYSMVEFDPKLGYPRRYVHTINQRTTSWEVQLAPVTPSSPPPSGPEPTLPAATPSAASS
ncbi:MAG TPA: DUF6174 domain-containing protein [Gemmatales bacterium]|nr:DUF6174 domain-containing protein [Gemmatales bacterium]HMP58726.1 DUF6174 domain-containing protein [Gemmatales bacterium]